MLKKYIKNKNGYVDMIIAVPIVIISVYLMTFFLDLASYSQKYLAVRKTADTVLRAISLQGTLNATTPDYIPGGSDEFWTNSDIREFLTEIFRQAGLDIDENNIQVVLDVEREFPNGNRRNGINLLSGSPSVRIDYASEMTIKISYRYDWMAIPGQISDVGISRTVSNEYKHRNQGWDGE